MMKFFIAMVCTIIVHGDNWNTNSQSSNTMDNVSNNQDDISNELDKFYEGDTLSFFDLSDNLMNNKIENDVCELQFNSNIMDLFQQKLLIGQIDSINQIISIQITFYDEYDNIIIDNNGNQIQFTLILHDLGHLLDFLRQGLTFSYLIFRLNLQPNCNFDPRTLFFHCAKSSSSIISTCIDGLKNRQETGLDCGGICAPKRKCLVGSGCISSKDCKSGVCISNICLPIQCVNNKQDNGESDMNCGGSCSLGIKCNISQNCNNSCDCQSNVCVSNVCLPIHCNSGVQDFGETGSDCGGPCSIGRKCGSHNRCNVSTDCNSGLCESNNCLPDHCKNGTQDFGETDVDCGGSCAPSKRCPVFTFCNSNADCATNICNSGICDKKICKKGCKPNKVCLAGFCEPIGNFSISMVWSKRDKSNLYVQTPTGKVINYSNTKAKNETDWAKYHENRDNFGPETIFWGKKLPLNGTYHICYEGDGKENITVTAIIRTPNRPLQKITKTLRNPSTSITTCNSSTNGYIGSVQYP